MFAAKVLSYFKKKHFCPRNL